MKLVLLAAGPVWCSMVTIHLTIVVCSAASVALLKLFFAITFSHVNQKTTSTDRLCLWVTCYKKHNTKKKLTRVSPFRPGLTLLQTSIFNGLRITLIGLMSLIRSYITQDMSQCPRVQDFVTATCGRKQVEHFLHALLAAEASAYKEWCAQQCLEGSIEVDGTFLTKFWISDSNDSFADQIYMLKKKLDKHHEKHPKSWQVHVMLLGAQKRGDSCPFLAFPTPVVTRNGERPPTESLRQIRCSGLLQKVRKSKRSCIFADGNQGWEILCGELGLEHRSVTHQVKQFTKPVQTAKTISSLAGTQTLDHSWGLLKKWLPDKMAAKDPLHKGLSDLFKNQVFAWAYRRHVGNVSPMTYLMSLTEVW